MAEFIEERISTDIRYNNSYTEKYDVDIKRTHAGVEYRRLVHPYPTRRFTVTYQIEASKLWSGVVSLYQRAYGKFAGFRAKNRDDFTSAADNVSAPAATDQVMDYVSGSTWQLVKKYAPTGSALPLGAPKRIIKKPVAGTVTVAIGGVALPQSYYAVATTTGQVNFPGSNTKTVTSATTGGNAIFTVNNVTGITAGDSMVYVNVGHPDHLKRGVVISTGVNTITTTINITVVVSSGTLTTAIQPAEIVTAGFQFDYPVRFDTDLDVSDISPNIRTVSVELIEILNP